MSATPGFGPAIYAFTQHKQWVTVAVSLLLACALQSFDARADLLFRSVEQVNGRPNWSPARNYRNPSDTANMQASTSGTEEVRVLLSGDITRADVDSFAVMEGLVESGRQKIAGNTVWLASNGGDIDAGMELARRLRKLGLSTVIGKNDQCLSACAFAFMGGARRSVAGRLGIHRPYFPFTQGGPDRQARFRHLEKTLKEFVAEMDFPDSLYEAVMLVPPESMQIVTPADLKRFYLEGISPSTEDALDAAAARGRNLSMYEYLKLKAVAPPCDFFDAGERRCEGRVQEAAASGRMANDPPGMQTNQSAPAGRADSISSGLPVRATKHSGIDSRDPT